MNKIKLCSVAMGSSMDTLIDSISLAENESELVEVRLDYLQHIDQNNIYVLRKQIKKEAIITCRRKDEGGKWPGSEDARLDVLRTAYVLGFDYVDVELKTVEEKRFLIPKRSRSKTIISFHDFKQTFPYRKLKYIALKMGRYNPDYIKIATMVNNENDTKSLQRLLINKKIDEEYIIIGMGEKGKQTRIIVPLLGSYLTYCSIGDSLSAPGQISCRKMKEIYSLIP